jgi:hypothetical protein
VDAAYRLGRLLHEPFGDAGLKVGEAREFVALLQCPPVGEDAGSVVAGPLDYAAPKSTDVLLKTIEEPFPHVFPVLWATDLGGVAATIRSRCLPVWCPATGTASGGDEEVEVVARTLLAEVLSERYWQVPLLVAKVKANAKQRSREPELIAEVVEAMSVMLDDPRVLKLWSRVRELAAWSNPTQIEVIAALLPE